MTSGHLRIYGLKINAIQFVVAAEDSKHESMNYEQQSTSSKSTQISTAEIQRIVDQLKLDRFRSSTKRTYYNVWKSFNKFFIKLDDKPISWEKRLILYVGYLISKRDSLLQLEAMSAQFEHHWPILV